MSLPSSHSSENSITPPLKTLGLRHAALQVSDPQRAKEFYQRTLLMQVEWEPDAENIYLTSDGLDNLALHKRSSSIVAESSAQFLDHIGFALETAEDVDRWFAWIEKQPDTKILRTPKTHRDGARSFYFQDPDGITIQMIHHPPIAKRALQAIVMLAIGLSLFSTSPARADWTAHMRVKIMKGESTQELNGKVSAQREMMRIDLESGAIPISSIVDLKKGTAWNLLHAQKLKMDTDLNQIKFRVPQCSTVNIVDCYKKNGFKKIGEENFDGHPCDIYQGNAGKNDQKSMMTSWYPKDLKEVVSIKSEIKNADGKIVTETLLSDIKIAPLARTTFVVPHDYQPLGGAMENFLGKHKK